jgi:hypothetical protein
MITLL